MKNRYTISGSLRRASRLASVQLMYQIEHGEVSLQDAISDFEYSVFYQDNNINYEKKINFEFLKKLLTGAVNNLNLIDDEIKNHLSNGWSIEKIPPVVLSILRIAIYEIIFEDTPNTVAINEYIEITKDFSMEKEAYFVNGILDKVSKKNTNTLSN